MAWDIVYYRTSGGAVPGLDFLMHKNCPVVVRASMTAVLDAVADAPPPRFSGGGMWEAMHGAMAGYYEVRKQGPQRAQFRLFCLLDNADPAGLKKRGLPGPAIAVITGLSKPWMTTFTPAEYAAVRAMGNDYLGTLPRRIG